MNSPERFVEQGGRESCDDLWKKHWKEQWKEGWREAWKEGWIEGFKQGQYEEAQRFVRRQIQIKFGDMPDWAEQRLAQASLFKLEGWVERMLFAESIDDLLGQNE